MLLIQIRNVGVKHDVRQNVSVITDQCFTYGIGPTSFAVMFTQSVIGGIYPMVAVMRPQCQCLLGRGY